MSFFETTDGTRLHYLDWGRGAPLVLIHGWPLNSAMWEYQLTELPKRGVRCIAYDRRGFGKSDAAWDGYDYTTLAQDLRDLLAHLKLENVTIAGFSMGGGEAVRYFSRFGGARVAKAVLIGAVPPFLLKTNDNPNGADKSGFDRMLADIAKDRAEFFKGFGKAFFGIGSENPRPLAGQGMLDWTWTMGMLGSPRATLECAKSFMFTDFRAEMTSIKAPALILHGDKDQIVPIAISGELQAKMIPNATLKVYKDAPHGLYFTHKDQMNEDLANFVLGTA